MPKSKSKFKKNICQFDEELLKGANRTPKVGKKTKEVSDRRKTEKAIGKNILAAKNVELETSVDYDRFEKHEIGCYMTEVFAIVIKAKKLNGIKLPSPFGDFTLSLMSTNNYLVKVEGVSMKAGKYENLLKVIDGFKYRSRLVYRLKDFLSGELDRKFYIDISNTEKIKSELYNNMKNGIRTANFRGLEDKVEVQLNSNIKKYTITYKQAGALMCGIFMAEIIRSSGKIVRSAFLYDKWPEDYKKLCKSLIQAAKGGNGDLRDLVMDPDSVSLETRQAAAHNASLFSPFKKVKK